MIGSSGLQIFPHNAKMHYNYANYLRDNNKLRAAMVHYNTAIRLVYHMVYTYSGLCSRPIFMSIRRTLSVPN